MNLSNIREFDSLELIARQIVEGFITGLHRSPFHGFSVEFAEHRLYNKGESTKHIDWKLFARTDKLFVKRYQEETNLRCQIVIDTSSSMLFPYNDKKLQSKLAFSVYSAASIIHLLRRQRDAVGLSFFSQQINYHSECKVSQLHAQILYNELSKLLNTKNLLQKTKTSTVLHQIAENIHKRSLVIIFSDMLSNENEDEAFAALQHLRHNKHEVILFHVAEQKKEINFEFESRPYRFVDMESGEEVKLNPNEVKLHYTNAFSHFFSKLKLKCAQYHIDMVEADINEGFHHVLLSYLMKRNKLL